MPSPHLPTWPKSIAADAQGARQLAAIDVVHVYLHVRPSPIRLGHEACCPPPFAPRVRSWSDLRERAPEVSHCNRWRGYSKSDTFSMVLMVLIKK
ncbi:hypothetical protein OPV22_021659 [Ensete ventricosum]|uniref:Uncharacterized protein n=1 Tax=Ensete ventricosum TaxID=4639 RepID=A0AAV8QP12_ENSVE|nr:hypothetical protein OPV22_021659 [Ensete ventricosum]